MKIIKWIIFSSENPENVSLFIKSAATFAVLFGIDATVINDAGNQIVSLVVAGGMIVSSLTALWGIIRKFKNGQWAASN